MSACIEGTLLLKPAESLLQPHQRRRLAPNVLCMFSEDRKPVVQHRRRGRLPRGVSSIKSLPRLRVGALADVVGGLFPENIGARVRLTQEDGGWFECKSLDRDLVWQDQKTGRRGRAQVVWFKPGSLRRVWRG